MAHHDHKGSYVLPILLMMTTGCDVRLGSAGVLQTTVIASPDTAVTAAPVRRLPEGKEVFREPVNAFVVVEERAELVMHGRSRWVHLSFDTPNRHVNVTLTDDGAKLYASVDSSACFSTVRPLQYEGSEDESDLYAVMIDLVASCRARITGADEYLALLERAKPGFPAAMRVMKARASQAFGRDMERCRLPDSNEYLDPNHPCR